MERENMESNEKAPFVRERVSKIIISNRKEDEYDDDIITFFPKDRGPMVRMRVSMWGEASNENEASDDVIDNPLIYTTMQLKIKYKKKTSSGRS